MSTVLVCDDHRVVREGLSALVATVPGVRRVVQAASGEEALARCAADDPDLVLMDLQMPGLGGLEATRQLLARNARVKVVVLSASDASEDVAAAVRYGARGYLVKDISQEQLRLAVSEVLGGGDLVEPTTRRALGRHSIPDDTAPRLTERELEVLRGMSQGKSNSQIGRDLFLSEDTVKTHARRLFRKLGVNDRAEAVARGFRRGLVS